MKKAKSIEQRAAGRGHSAWSTAHGAEEKRSCVKRKEGTEHRAWGTEQRVKIDRAKERLSEGAIERQRDRAIKFLMTNACCLMTSEAKYRAAGCPTKQSEVRSSRIATDLFPLTSDQCLLTSDQYLVTSVAKLSPAQRDDQCPMTNDQCPVTTDFKPETLNFKLRTRVPQQVFLHGSRYKNSSQLPREEFNSGVCPGAAAITISRSKFSSHRATLPGDTSHPKYLTDPAISCINNKFLGQKVWEELPMN